MHVAQETHYRPGLNTNSSAKTHQQDDSFEDEFRIYAHIKELKA